MTVPKNYSECVSVPSECSEMYVVNVYWGQKICVVNVESSLFIYLKAHLKVEITLLSGFVALTLK